jgi:hypothetical protein
MQIQNAARYPTSPGNAGQVQRQNTAQAAERRMAATWVMASQESKGG